MWPFNKKKTEKTDCSSPTNEELYSDLRTIHSENASLISENDRLKEENEKLKAQIAPMQEELDAIEKERKEDELFFASMGLIEPIKLGNPKVELDYNVESPKPKKSKNKPTKKKKK